jgi:hypothetical protein
MKTRTAKAIDRRICLKRIRHIRKHAGLTDHEKLTIIDGLAARTLKARY